MSKLDEALKALEEYESQPFLKRIGAGSDMRKVVTYIVLIAVSFLVIYHFHI